LFIKRKSNKTDEEYKNGLNEKTKCLIKIKGSNIEINKKVLNKPYWGALVYEFPIIRNITKVNNKKESGL